MPKERVMPKEGVRTNNRAIPWQQSYAYNHPLLFVIPSVTWACGPPKIMKKVSVRRPLSLYRCPLLVIPTGAKRSGGICGSTDPSWICFSTERSEESAVRLEPSPIPKGSSTANSHRAYFSPEATISISGHMNLDFKYP